MSSGHAGYRKFLAREFWEARYRLYQRDCAQWNLPAQPFEDFKAYWEVFAKEGELPTSAPILVQRV